MSTDELQTQIDIHRKEIHTDGYAMSIGELTNLYEERELDIHPAYQRFFRWETPQKSAWIESLLLRIPVPPIFVSQREDGVWDVVDGLQRLSTLLELMGRLRDENDELLPPLRLGATKYLPGLKDKVWIPEFGEPALSQDQRRYIKRAKLDIQIVLRESSKEAKYELFQRLNTGGTFLTAQELRNCILISANREFFDNLKRLSDDENFQSCLALSDRKIDEQFDMELVVRFLVLRDIDEPRLRQVSELGDFLTDEVLKLAQTASFDWEKETENFGKTFRILAESLADDSFRKFDRNRDRFVGASLISAFEVIALGIGHALRDNPRRTFEADDVVAKVQKDVWNDPDFVTFSGRRATERLVQTIPRGRSVFGE